VLGGGIDDNEKPGFLLLHVNLVYIAK